MSLPDDKHLVFTTSLHPAEDEPECLFFKLPLELRTDIYNGALIHKAVLEIAPSGDPVTNMDEWELTDQSWAKLRPSEPSLLFTCKQIREEGLRIYYGSDIFPDSFYDAGLRKFIKWLTPQKRTMIKHLQIDTNSLSLRWPGWPWAGFGCVSRAQKKKQAFEKWLQKEDIQVNESAIEVYVQLSDGDEWIWSNSPQGACELSGCCRKTDKRLRL